MDPLNVAGAVVGVYVLPFGGPPVGHSFVGERLAASEDPTAVFLLQAVNEHSHSQPHGMRGDGRNHIVMEIRTRVSWAEAA